MAADEKLQTIRHSCSHVMAEAVLRLFPGTKIAIGPAVENGFYYDFDFPKDRKFSEADFPAVEKEMRRILAGDHEFVRREISREEALALFRDQPYKTELIRGLPEGETISAYTQDGFTDLCRGPHVKSTREINAQAFKLDKTAGAYWRGDSGRPMLTRVYAVCFEKPDDLKQYEKMMAEAEKRDHRRLGAEMDLFHLDPENPGQIFWHPNGWTLNIVIRDYMRGKLRRDGYSEVNTPAVMPRSLWERSGHWDHYKQNMFITESEKRLFAVKPMNCPGAIEIFNSRQRSYRDLPMRLAEFGNDVRNEPSGTLHGLMRVRGFVQDDAHILCTEEQISPEVTKFCRLLKDVYKDFGFEKNILVMFSTMPEDHVGTEEDWRRAEDALARACREADLEYQIQEGEGAFYGPKLEFQLLDSIGRRWQCGTIQVDYQLPSAERLNAQYIGHDNQKHHPVMLHRAVLGSIERFTGILIENYAGALPAWLHFEQAAVVPVNDGAAEYARKVNDALLAADIRSNAYLSEDNMRSKIKMITSEHKTPYILVVGQKEESDGTVCVRFRPSSGIPQRTFRTDEFISYVREKTDSHFAGI